MVDVLQGFVAELLLELKTAVRPLVDILSDLVVVLLGLLALQTDLLPLNDVVRPISDVHHVDGELRVFADVHELLVALEDSQGVVVVGGKIAEVDVG